MNRWVRLHITAEGQTEEAFINRVLKEHLRLFQVETNVRCLSINKGARRYHKGGILDYGRTKKDIHLWMKEDDNPDSYFTTMFDFYALPDSFFELIDELENREPYQLVHKLETNIHEDFDTHPRFVPYIQLHEFEALLLADIQKFDWEFIEHSASIRELNKECSQFKSPELIDHRKEHAPSKRIIRHIPEYRWRKASAGPIIASKIGLDVIRTQCRHFDEWLTKLESMGQEA